MKHAPRAATTAALLSIAIATLLPATSRAQAADPDSGRIQLSYEPSVVRLSRSTGTYPLSIQLTGGWRFSHAFAVEAFVASPFTIETGCGKNCDEYIAGTSYGVRAVGYLPLAERWDLMGDVGLANTSQHLPGQANTNRTRTDGVLGAGILWRSSPHLSLGLTTTWLANTHIPYAGVRSEWRF